MLGNIFGGIASLFQPGAQNHLTPQAAPTQPRYNASQGPLSIEAITGQQQKPFQYETPKQQSATSFLDLANQAGKTAQQYAKPVGNFWYNNQPVDEATYRRLTAAPAPAAQAPATNNMNLSGAAGVLKGIQDSTQENRARFNQVWDKLNAAQNPYDVNGQAFQGALNSATNRANRSMSGAEARTQGALAGRGMLGSGYEAAALGNVAAQRGALVSDTQGRMYDDAYRSGAQWEQDKLRGAASLVAGDYSGTLSALDSLAKLPGYLDAQGIDNAGGLLRNEGQGTQNKLAALRLEYEPQMLQLGLDSARVEAMVREGEAEARKGEAAQKVWEQKNSWWLGPLKGYVNVVSSVLSAAAGR